MPKPDFTNLTPEEQREWEKENRVRLTREDLEDMLYQQREREKLKKELKITKEKPPSKPKDLSKIERERQQVEEFMAQQQKEEGKKQKEEKSLERLMLDPSIIQNPSKPTCMNQVGGKQCGEPATVKLIHGGLLGEETPPITLCKYCSKLLKIIPIGESDPDLERRLKKQKLEKELGKFEKERSKSKKYKGNVPGSQTLSIKGMRNILQKIAKFANKLDAKGLTNDADLLDEILKDYNGAI